MKMLEFPSRAHCDPVGRRAQTWRDYNWRSFANFAAVHVLAGYGLWRGGSWAAWGLCALLYVGKMFFVTAGYHRYFSHRSFKMGRILQFIFAFGAMTTGQKGVLWWAAHHRNHHKYSDTVQDVHSMIQYGFWHSHVMWIYDGNSETDYARVKDLTKFPELVMLDKAWWVPPIVLGAACFLVLGGPGLWIGFMLSTVLTWHGTFTINSLTHVWGRQRFVTGDHSRNSWFLALLTLGEGWHNNHHYFMNSTRQGFYWWEIDLTYYMLKAMSWFRLVWDLKEPPARVLAPQCPDRVRSVI